MIEQEIREKIAKWAYNLASPAYRNNIHYRFSWDELLARVDTNSHIKGIVEEYRQEADKILEEAGWVQLHPKQEFPKVICLCGSTRFGKEFQKAQLKETLAGKIVLTIGYNMRDDAALFKHLTTEEFTETKRKLDELHLRKIDLADEVLVLNVGGYIGGSTAREIAYAKSMGKPINYIEDEISNNKETKCPQ